MKLHITGMGTSYVLLLTAFYVDNGKNLPLWRDLRSDRLLVGARRPWDTAYCSSAAVAPVGADPATAFPTILDLLRKVH